MQTIQLGLELEIDYAMICYQANDAGRLAAIVIVVLSESKVLQGAGIEDPTCYQ